MRPVPVRHVWCLSDGGDGGGGGPIDGDGGGGDDYDDGDESDGDDASSALTKAGVDSDALPEDVLTALNAGRIGATELTNWQNMMSSPITKALGATAFIRNRLMAEPRLTTVLAIEIALGCLSTLAAEWTSRGSKFWKELDFVISNQVLIVVTNVALVMALCPVAAITPPPAAGTYAAWSAKLPGYFAQKGDFTVFQRAACFVSKAVQFSFVGAGASAIGQATTLGLVEMRTRLNPDDPPNVKLAPVPRAHNMPRPTHIRATITPFPSQPTPFLCTQVLPTSIAFAGFMVVSSNTRYQIVNSFEANLLPSVPGGAAAQAVTSFVLRTYNNYLGSSNWIWWAKFNGLQ